MAVDNVLLLRVGVDSNTGEGHGPLFEDNTFDYIPIPEGSATSEDRTYDEIPSRGGQSLSSHVPHLADDHPHFDPEFETYTYGDPSSNKRSQLTRLTSDDLLIFYSSLSPQDVDVGPRLYAIGYFTVDRVYDLKEMTPPERDEVFDEISNNAHVKREGLTTDSPHRDNFPAIVKGRPHESHLFETARPLGDSERNVLPWVADIIGFEGDLTRAGVARVLDEDNAPEIKTWLAEGSDVLIEEGATLRSYVMTSDTGFAPNVTGGYCTLATCKPRIRRNADVGEWVLGTPSKSEGQEQLTYLTRVDDAMSYDEYYRDGRFEMKKPKNDPDGDNIYYEEEGLIVQDENAGYHTDQENRKRDLKANRVLIGETFWYFGGDGPPIPESLRHGAIRGYKSDSRRLHEKNDRDILSELVEWCSLRFDPGVRGRPAAVSSEESTSGSGC